jgi:hypothetical protein
MGINMKLWLCGFVLTVIALAAVAGKADTLDAQALASQVATVYPVSAEKYGALPALMVTRDVPEPRSVLLLAAGLISLALLTTIGRPPFRLKF